MSDIIIECCRCGSLNKTHNHQLPDGWSEFHITQNFGKDAGTVIKYKCIKCNLLKPSSEIKSEKHK